MFRRLFGKDDERETRFLEDGLMKEAFDKNKSLKELENKIINESVSTTSLTESVCRLWNIPIKEYSVDDLRLMIGQSIGLKYLLPLAIEKLSENPFVQGDFYPGDLLVSVLSIEKSFWESHPQFYYETAEIIAGLPDVLKDIDDSIQKFEISRI